jgi:hypothetical protein
LLPRIALAQHDSPKPIPNSSRVLIASGCHRETSSVSLFGAPARAVCRSVAPFAPPPERRAERQHLAAGAVPARISPACHPGWASDERPGGSDAAAASVVDPPRSATSAPPRTTVPGLGRGFLVAASTESPAPAEPPRQRETASLRCCGVARRRVPAPERRAELRGLAADGCRAKPGVAIGCVSTAAAKPPLGLRPLPSPPSRLSSSRHSAVIQEC